MTHIPTPRSIRLSWIRLLALLLTVACVCVWLTIVVVEAVNGTLVHSILPNGIIVFASTTWLTFFFEAKHSKTHADIAKVSEAHMEARRRRMVKDLEALGLSAAEDGYMDE